MARRPPPGGPPGRPGHLIREPTRPWAAEARSPCSVGPNGPDFCASPARRAAARGQMRLEPINHSRGLGPMDTSDGKHGQCTTSLARYRPRRARPHALRSAARPYRARPGSRPPTPNCATARPVASHVPAAGCLPQFPRAAASWSTRWLAGRRARARVPPRPRAPARGRNNVNRHRRPTARPSPQAAQTAHRRPYEAACFPDRPGARAASASQ